MHKEFRATLWFKKGDLDAAAAADAAGSGDDLHPGAVDLVPAEDRYLDDGTVTADDRATYSLVTGHTRALPRPADAVTVPDGGNVDLLVRDIKRGRRAALVALGAAATLVGAAAVLFAL
jgi:hypothetical protein